MPTAAAFAFDPSQKRGDERCDEMPVSAMTEDDDGEIEFSPLCGTIKQGGRAVRVDIFRLPGEKRWSLAVFEADSPSVVWSEDFATDRDAYAEFYRSLNAEGIPSLLEE
jgi:hypothetical protein